VLSVLAGSGRPVIGHSGEARLRSLQDTGASVRASKRTRRTPAVGDCDLALTTSIYATLRTKLDNIC
jgi:hypothetical protein